MGALLLVGMALPAADKVPPWHMRMGVAVGLLLPKRRTLCNCIDQPGVSLVLVLALAEASAVLLLFVDASVLLVGVAAPSVWRLLLALLWLLRCLPLGCGCGAVQCAELAAATRVAAGGSCCTLPAAAEAGAALPALLLRLARSP